MATTTAPTTSELSFAEMTTDEIEQQMLTVESVIARGRALQMAAIGELDRRQTHTADGCRTMVEWVASRFDVHSETARRLVATAKRLEALPTVTDAARDGTVSFDRIWATAKAAVVGEDDTDLVDEHWRYSVDGLARLSTRRHRLTRGEEREAFRRRFVHVQPNLDESSWRINGRLPGQAGRVLVDALDHKVEELPNEPYEPRSTRRADALWQMSIDSLQGSDGATVESATPLLTVFMDANDAAPANGEAGAWIESGPRVGLDALDAILCTGVVEVTAKTPDGTPLDMGRKTRVIPPRLRRFVLARDDGCTIAGCTSRYRLQAHHITPWSDGGRTDAANLTTVCWYHHHVAIHGRGFTIDPNSPTHRRRLHPPVRGPPDL
ncbi:MAG: DUF222 domain-containing protein [Actinomycetota bacterium]